LNAGAYGSELADVLRQVELASAEGVDWHAADDFDWGYRTCVLPADVVVTAVKMELAPGDCTEILDCHRSTLRKRRTVQPQGVRTFGSTFKNPSGVRLVGSWRPLDSKECSMVAPKYPRSTPTSW